MGSILLRGVGWLLPVVVGLSGCHRELPSWYTHRPPTLYEGVGVGPSRQLAVEEGVLEALQQLEGRVEGWVASRVSYTGKGEEVEQFREVGVRVEASAPFLSYRVLKLEKVGENWYALVKIDPVESRRRGEVEVARGLERLERLAAGGRWELLRHRQEVVRLLKKVERGLHFLQLLGGGGEVEQLSNRFRDLYPHLYPPLPVELEAPEFCRGGVAEGFRRLGIPIGTGGVVVHCKLREREWPVEGLVGVQWKGEVVVTDRGRVVAQLPVELEVEGVPDRGALRRELGRRLVQLLLKGG